ncbi:MAG: hypothetical protein R3301_16870, partial [Saprospiraceae bacterium]|nr:hypothetical protein [Saprospiraceae bacterium]
MRNVSTSLKPRVPFSFHQPVRVLLALIICFVITPQEGTAQLCDCTDYIYLADQQPGGGLDTIGKYRIEADGSLTEIGSPWFVAPSDITLVSGVAQDRNGYIYAGEDQFSGDTRRLTCDGTLDPEASFVVNDRGYNLGVLGDLLLINTIEFDFVSPDAGDSIHAYRLCDGSLVGAVGLTGLGASVAGQVDWGFQVLDNGYVLATADIGLPGGNAVWYFQPTETNFANGDGFAPIFTEANSDLSSGNLFGITTDGNFIYIVETAAGGASTIYKYDFSGNEIGFISDGAADGVGFFAAIGIVFSQSTGYLYVTSQQMDDCIARIDTTGTMSYDGVALPPNLDGSGVALTIATECCPSSPSVTIDTTLCNIAVNDSFFLQDLIACDGPVCEGTWTADGGNSGVTFNTCDFSVRIDDISGCGTFTLTSAGGLCGAFTITLNIDFTTITSPTMSADQLVCAGSEADTLFAAGAASPTGLTFQWQESAGSCTGPFTDIAGATDTFFVPGAISDTMFYRLISSAPGGCDYDTCRDTSACITVLFVDPACQASTNSPICEGDALQLMETGGDAVAWSWSTTNGGVFSDPNAQNPTVTGVVDGETFTVTITDANGCTSVCTTVATVRELPGCAATNSGPICDGETLTIEETGGDAVSWSWASSGSAVIADPSAMVTTATNVSDGEIFTVTVTDIDGCMSTCTTVAVVNALPMATAGNSGAICDGETLDLTETGGDAVAWSWSSDGTAAINNINDQNPQATGVANGEIFTVTVTDVNGCTSTATTTATVNALPACSASTGGAICDEGTLTLMETGGDATGWSWSSDGGATIMDANMATATATGVTHGETFTVTVTDANGCTSTCTVVAVVNDLPGCATTNSGPICAGESLTIEETGGDAVSWSWTSNGAAVIADPSAMVTTATNVADGEIFTVTVTDANGCTSTCTTVATVNPLPTATAGNSGA